MIPLPLLLALAAPAPAVATSGSVEASAPAPAVPSDGLSKRKHRKWIDRWAPERNTAELGVYGGIILPARDLELFEADRNLPQIGRASCRERTYGYVRDVCGHRH